MKKLNVASLFCGCGGMDLGTLGNFDFMGKHYDELETKIVYALDFNPYAIKTYNANFKDQAVCANIIDEDFTKIEEEVDLLIGGFPCQPFSTANKRTPLTEGPDTRADLYLEVVRFLQTKRPKLFICENVRGLLSKEKGKVFENIKNSFAEQGYNVDAKILKSVEYGVPQRRERVIIIGVRQDLDFHPTFPEPTTLNKEDQVPIRSLIDTEVDEKYYYSERAVQSMIRRNIETTFKCGQVQDLDKPAQTMTCHLARHSLMAADPCLKFGDRYRNFTPREVSRIQSFPENFVFPCSNTRMYTQFGNAVPPVLMWHVVNNLIKDYKNFLNK